MLKLHTRFLRTRLYVETCVAPCLCSRVMWVSDSVREITLISLMDQMARKLAVDAKSPQSNCQTAVFRFFTRLLTRGAKYTRVKRRI
ncbi:hypothetical protein AVEN_124778-1 [Araneus ventricosus]|uniref:Uncharacterized protein n=1 Tax=Araneus ventricosus TaxID=182803 RepID=A0A4Y2W1K3_ARAVE|nr:hypothetical protein AVEN_124778-1 [Araneus ventricosus]